MSLKAELETWAHALEAYDGNELNEAMRHFEKISDTSKICWNIGIILATMGRHEEAIMKFEEATKLDGYFTVAYHQKGVSNFMLGRFQDAYRDFENALLCLRGNQTINYEQLGLDFRLYSAEVLFNCGLTKIYLGQTAAGMQDLREASTQKQVGEHAVIDDAVRDLGKDYNVFSVPVGVLFRPSPVKLKNLAAKDYMGKAVLVAASDVNDAYTTFSGITRLRRGQTPTGALLDRNHPLGRSASVSAIPEPDDKIPVSARLSRSNSIAAPVTHLKPASPPAQPLATPRQSHRLVSDPRPSLSLNTEMRSIPPLIVPKISPLRSISPLTAPRPEPARQASGDSNGRQSPLLRTPPGQGRINTLRITELYDDYYKDPTAYDDDLPALPPIGDKKRELEAWTKKTPFGRSPSSVSRTLPPSSFGGGRGLTRAPSRSGSLMEGSRTSRYEDESDGAMAVMEMAKIRVKVHVDKHTRGMSVFPDQAFEDFVSALKNKFPELRDSLDVRFKDEDGDMLSMQDEGDFEAAVDVARVMARGRAEGRLEIWVD